MDINPADLRQHCQKEIANPTGSAVDKFRSKIFLRKGTAGIKSIGRMFKIFDDDGNRNLSREEFKKGATERGIKLEEKEMEELFAEIDKDSTGFIEYEEFLKALRGPMSESRMDLVKKAFKKLDETGDGIVTDQDLVKKYDIKHHPKYKSGEWTATQCRRSFLDTFDIQDNPDGKVTIEEFINYYSGVSISIDKDAYFDLMMRNAWNL
ncbi:calcyphosin-like protein [Haliotis rufescens]|uniref:calcyphosin-like protein n=1 Tax=Haliotis rufescens TaxID=6454 RepID=UPI001EB067EE|nr:calcyphosin-like protein [Haliotis rufescens]